MGSYNAEPEVGLISKWLSYGEDGDVDSDDGPGPEAMIDSFGRSGWGDAGDRGQQAANVPAEYAAGSPLPMDSKVGLRVAALENLYSKLDMRKQGYLEDLDIINGVVIVRANSSEGQIPVQVTPYEAGLLSYALPTIDRAIQIAGRITHERLIYILSSILFTKETESIEPERKGGREEHKQVDRSAMMDTLRRQVESPRGDEGGELAVPLSMQDKENTTVGSNLLGMIGRLYKKLDPEGLGYLDSVPDPDDLTPFESALYELTKSRLAWEFHRKRTKAMSTGFGDDASFRVGKQVVVNMLCETMEQDLHGQKKRLPAKGGASAEPLLETEVRSMRRVAAKMRQIGKDKFVRPWDSMQQCTFTPEIMHSTRPNSAHAPRTSATASLANTMSTKAREELLELQECTFQPNLHKCVAPKPEEPKYRLHRRPGDQNLQKAQRDWRRHYRQDGAFTRWAENLRSFASSTPIDPPTNPSSHARRDVSPGKSARKADMDLSVSGRRRDFRPRTDQGELDWGAFIRLNSQRFREQTADFAEEEENTRVFAETFLSMRSRAGRGRELTL